MSGLRFNRKRIAVGVQDVEKLATVKAPVDGKFRNNVGSTLGTLERLGKLGKRLPCLRLTQESIFVRIGMKYCEVARSKRLVPGVVAFIKEIGG